MLTCKGLHFGWHVKINAYRFVNLFQCILNYIFTFIMHFCRTYKAIICVYLSSCFSFGAQNKIVHAAKLWIYFWLEPQSGRHLSWLKCISWSSSVSSHKGLRRMDMGNVANVSKVQSLCSFRVVVGWIIFTLKMAESLQLWNVCNSAHMHAIQRPKSRTDLDNETPWKPRVSKA